MNHIIVKIPRKKQKLKIIRNEEIIRREFDKKVKELEMKYLKELQEIEQEKQRKQIEEEAKPVVEEVVAAPEPIIKKTLYTEIFTITDSNQPVEIDMRFVPEETVSINFAANEIQKSYEKGFIDGQESARSTHETEINTHREWIKRFDAIAFALKKEFVGEQRKFQDNLLELSMIIAEKIIDEKIIESENVVISQIKKSIDEIGDDEIFKILVNPDDYEVLSSIKSEMISDIAGSEKVNLVKSSKIEKGGCVLETSAGTIDARISVQLNRIHTALIEADNIQKLKRTTEISDDYPDVLDTIVHKSENYDDIYPQDVISDEEINNSPDTENPENKEDNV